MPLSRFRDIQGNALRSGDYVALWTPKGLVTGHVYLVHMDSVTVGHGEVSADNLPVEVWNSNHVVLIQRAEDARTPK
jgi:hypothetical protein